MIRQDSSTAPVEVVAPALARGHYREQLAVMNRIIALRGRKRLTPIGDRVVTLHQYSANANVGGVRFHAERRSKIRHGKHRRGDKRGFQRLKSALRRGRPNKAILLLVLT